MCKRVGTPWIAKNGLNEPELSGGLTTIFLFYDFIWDSNISHKIRLCANMLYVLVYLFSVLYETLGVASLFDI
jgi:hypothetical protein